MGPTVAMGRDCDRCTVRTSARGYHEGAAPGAAAVLRRPPRLHGGVLLSPAHSCWAPGLGSRCPLHGRTWMDETSRGSVRFDPDCRQPDITEEGIDLRQLPAQRTPVA